MEHVQEKSLALFRFEHATIVERPFGPLELRAPYVGEAGARGNTTSG